MALGSSEPATDRYTHARAAGPEDPRRAGFCCWLVGNSNLLLSRVKLLAFESYTVSLSAAKGSGSSRGDRPDCLCPMPDLSVVQTEDSDHERRNVLWDIDRSIAAPVGGQERTRPLPVADNRVFVCPERHRERRAHLAHHSRKVDGAACKVCFWCAGETGKE